MASRFHFLFLALTVCWLSSTAKAETDESINPNPKVPTHADAALFFAKYSGLFDRYVSEDASLSQCVTFLNKAGIYFGLKEIVEGEKFTVQDCARVMGQMNLVFSGEAAYSGGKVKLPSGIESWEDFCILNDVKYIEGYQNLVSAMAVLQELAR